MDAIRLVEAAQLKKDRAGFAPGVRSASTAANNGSGFRTMPPPPPN